MGNPEFRWTETSLTKTQLQVKGHFGCTEEHDPPPKVLELKKIDEDDGITWIVAEAKGPEINENSG